MATRLEAILAEADAAGEGPSFVRPLGSKRHSGAPTPRIHRVDDLLLRKFEPIRWAIRDMVPEGVTLLVGPPKIGKSWLTLQLAIAIATGDRVWKGRAPEDAGDVLMLGLEDNDRRIQSRVRKLQAATAELEMVGGFVEGVRTSDVSRMHYATEWPRMNQGGVDFIAEWLVEHPHARLVIIDTLAKFRPPESGKASAYAADYEVGAALKPLADRFNVAILLVHHTRKMSATDVLDTVSGTQGLTGSVDALLLLRRERGSMDAALYITGRDIEREEDYALQFHSESCTWSALGSMHTVARTRERQAIVDFLQSNGPSKPKDIAEGLGKKGSGIRRLLQKLFGDGAVRLEDGKYALPLIHSSGNSGNNGNEGATGDSGTSVTAGTSVTDVTVVTAPEGA